MDISQRRAISIEEQEACERKYEEKKAKHLLERKRISDELFREVGLVAEWRKDRQERLQRE